jgi:hypothetical protein
MNGQLMISGINSISSSQLLLKHPFNLIISGASGSGKTEWVLNFLNNLEKIVTKKFSHILYCYGIFDNRIFELQKFGAEIHDGIPTKDTLNKCIKPLLLILDDLMLESKSDFLNLLFTKISHHMDISVIFVTQDAFSKELKTARNNAHYMVLMKNPAGELQIRNLGLQLFPRRLNYFLESYRNATEKNFKYLFIDMHPSSNEILKLRTNIFPGEIPILFISKN